jgi:tetratricopeptide (TPR) repeat protein
VLYNTGIQRLLGLDFAGCLETMDRYQRLFPWGQTISSVMEMARFLNENLAGETSTAITPKEAGRRYEIWREFERAFGYPWKRDAIEERLQVQYFSRLLDGLAAGGHSGINRLPGDIPLGLVHLLGHRLKEAIECLQASIQERPDRAAPYGYLGDAYVLLGDVRRARLCYREAFAVEPREVDLPRLQDTEIRQFLDALAEDEDLEDDPIVWLPVLAQLECVFERRFISDLDTLDQWLTRYLALLEDYEDHWDRALIPKLFYHAMVLSDNESLVSRYRKIDLPAIRRNMKNWQPVLFARHMRQLELGK